MELTPKYYPINEEQARLAWENNHWNDYKQGSSTNEYQSLVNEMYEHAAKAIKKDPEDAEQIAKIADRYAYKLAENFNDRFRIERMAPSWLLAGPANFPVRKKEKQNAARDRNYREWDEIEKLKDKINSIVAGKNIIMSGDANAIDKLQKKINEAKTAHERMVRINAYYRKNKTAKGSPDLTDADAEKIDNAMRENTYRLSDVPFASYSLQNSNANIKRLEERLRDITKAKAVETREYDAGDFKIVENTDLMRLQLLFDGKPDADTRTKLKKQGFRWSPSNSAWQRELNPNGRYALNSFLKENGITTDWKPSATENFSKEASTRADDPSKDKELAPVKMTKDTEKVGFKQGKYVRPMKTPNGLLAVAGQGLYKDYKLQDGSTIRLWVHNTDDNIDEETRTVTSNHPRKWIITEDSSGAEINPWNMGWAMTDAGTPATADYVIRSAIRSGRLETLLNKIKQAEDFDKHLKLVADYKEKRSIPTVHLNKEVNDNIQDNSPKLAPPSTLNTTTGKFEPDKHYVEPVEKPEEKTESPKIVRDPEAEAKYKQMLKDYWDGKVDVNTLYAYGTQLVKENKIDQKIIDSIESQATEEYNAKKAMSAPKPEVTSTAPELVAKKKNQQISWKQGALKDKKKNKLNALWVIAEKTNGKWHGEYSLFPPEGREKETGSPFSSKNTIDFDGGSVPEDMSFLLSSWSISLEDSKPKYKRMTLPTNKQLTNNAFKGK